jgi:hypothetical protein
MKVPKNVTTDRVWLRDDLNDKVDRIDEEWKLTRFLESSANGSAIGQYLRQDRKEAQGPHAEYRFFYDPSSQKADYLAVWAGLEKYPTVIRHTVENVSADEAKAIDTMTACALRHSPAQFGWAVAELEIQRQAQAAE